MRTRGLVILTVVVVALGLWILLVERHAPSTEEQLQDGDRVLPGLEDHRIVAVQLRNQHGAFRFERGGSGSAGDDRWRLTEPIVADADQSAVRSALSALEGLEAERRLEPGEVELAAYGLDQPPVEIAVETSEATYRLAVGEATPLGDRRAVTVDGTSVVLTPEWFMSRLDKELSDWRSRSVVELSTPDVVSVVIERRGDRVELVRDGAVWRLRTPVTDLADRDRVEGLIADLNALQIEEFLDSEEAARDSSVLDPPRLKVTVLERDSEPTTLELGPVEPAADADQAGNRMLCRINGSKVVRVSDDAEAKLASAVRSWRASRLAAFDTWSVDALRIETRAAREGDRQVVTIERKDGQWTSPDGAVDATAVLDLLSDLADLRVTELDLPAPTSAPAATVQLTVGEGPDLVLTFYPPSDDSTTVPVTSSIRPGTLGVAASAVESVLDTERLLASDESSAAAGETAS
jgi:hypothetical protein